MNPPRVYELRSPTAQRTRRTTATVQSMTNSLHVGCSPAAPPSVCAEACGEQGASRDRTFWRGDVFARDRRPARDRCLPPAPLAASDAAAAKGPAEGVASVGPPGLEPARTSVAYVGTECTGAHPGGITDTGSGPSLYRDGSDASDPILRAAPGLQVASAPVSDAPRSHDDERRSSAARGEAAWDALEAARVALAAGDRRRARRLLLEALGALEEDV